MKTLFLTSHIHLKQQYWWFGKLVLGIFLNFRPQKTDYFIEFCMSILLRSDPLNQSNIGLFLHATHQRELLIYFFCPNMKNKDFVQSAVHHSFQYWTILFHHIVRFEKWFYSELAYLLKKLGDIGKSMKNFIWRKNELDVFIFTLRNNGLYIWKSKIILER